MVPVGEVVDDKVGEDDERNVQLTSDWEEAERR